MATITQTFSRSTEYRVTQYDTADFNMDTISFPSSSAEVRFFYVTFEGALSSINSSSRSISIQLQVECNDSWITIWSGNMTVYSYYTDTTLNLSGAIPSSYYNTLAQYGITGIRVYSTGSNNFMALPSDNTITFTYNIPITLTPPTNVVVQQSGDNFIISWDKAIGTGGTGSVTYQVIYGPVGSLYPETPITETTVTMPLFYPADSEITPGTNGYSFAVIAFYEGLEEGSDEVYYAPQHVIYYNTGTKWQQCEVYYFNGSSFQPCKINYYNGHLWVG